MDKPILFNADMVRAILEGRKVQTRRIIKPQPKTIERDPKKRVPEAFWVDNQRWIKPPYQPGDTLWVRETWQQGENEYLYLEKMLRDGVIYTDLDDDPIKWKPSIYMPREAARLFLRVKSVPLERVKEISREDAVAEGVIKWICEEHKSGSYLDNAMRAAACAKPERAFALLWDSIYAKPKPVHIRDEHGNKHIVYYESFPFDGESKTEIYKGKPHYICANPRIWVYKFERLTAHE